MVFSAFGFSCGCRELAVTGVLRKLLKLKFVMMKQGKYASDLGDILTCLTMFPHVSRYVSLNSYL
jgi:hypothetical protein